MSSVDYLYTHPEGRDPSTRHATVGRDRDPRGRTVRIRALALPVHAAASTLGHQARRPASSREGLFRSGRSYLPRGSSNSAYTQLGNVRIIKGFEYCNAHSYNPLKPLTPVEGAEHRFRVEHDGASRALTEINGPMMPH